MTPIEKATEELLEAGGKLAMAAREILELWERLRSALSAWDNAVLKLAYLKQEEHERAKEEMVGCLAEFLPVAEPKVFWAFTADDPTPRYDSRDECIDHYLDGILPEPLPRKITIYRHHAMWIVHELIDVKVWVNEHWTDQDVTWEEP